jgi:hypothetical protein
MWFGIGRLTSPSWTVASDVAFGSTSPLSGNRFWDVIRHWRDLYQVPMQLAALGSVAIAIFRRDRATLVLTGAALVWVAAEVAMAYHGWNAPSRYLFAPAAVMVVVAGVGVGRALQASPSSLLLRLAFPAVVVALVVALVPAARTWERLFHNKVSAERLWRTQIDHLHTLLGRQGGARRIFACAPPVSYLGFQPIIAWYLGKNVSDIGWNPPDAIKSGAPIVLYQLQGGDSRWVARPLHYAAAHATACGRLRLS